MQKNNSLKGLMVSPGGGVSFGFVLLTLTVLTTLRNSMKKLKSIEIKGERIENRH